MKFFAKGPEEKEKKEKCKSTADKGVMIEEVGGCGHGGWLLEDETIAIEVHHCHHQQLQRPQQHHTQ